MKTQSKPSLAKDAKSTAGATDVAAARAAFWKSPALWPLVTGLAVGILVGREAASHRAQPAAADAAGAAAVAPAPAVAPARAPTAPADVAAAKYVLSPSSPRKGPNHAKVTLVEISDFECPFCGRAAGTVAELQKKYAKDVAFVFVNQPLSFHKSALPAAKAALAAHRQGAFWPYHDTLFAHQQALSPADLEKYAADLKLNLARFKKDLADPALEKLVDADHKLADSVGASGTPTFLVNGHKVVGAKPVDAFASVIDAELKKADALLAKGVALADVAQKLTDEALAAAPAPDAPPARVDIALGDSPAKGPSNAPVTIISFSDFQCPFCSKAPPILKQLEDDYKGKVRLAFKNLPLSFHNNAQLAAEAALAAHEQGMFWAFHDKLFANQQSLDRPSLEKYAVDLGLNLHKFRVALDSGKFKAQVQKDAAQAASAGATGTPTFFINGQRLVGAQPIDAFKRLIDQELKKRAT